MRIRNPWFLSGFFITAVVCVVMNVRSYYVARSVFDARRFHFSHEGFEFGFPFAMFWEGTCFPCDGYALQNLMAFAINVSVSLAAAGLIGILAEIGAEKIVRSTDFK